MKSILKTLSDHKIFILILVIAFFNLSCQNGNTNFIEGSSDNSSRLDIPNNPANTPKDIALCNKKDTPNITMQLMVYYDQYTTYHPEFIRLYIPQIHGDFEKTRYQLVFRKWKASASGTTYQDPTPLKLWAEKKSQKTPVTSWMDALKWSTLSAELQKTGTTYTLSQAFSQFSFVIDLKDFAGEYDVLKVSLYDDGKWMEDWNLLLPAFYAHPATYAQNQNGVLAKLHPLYGQSEASLVNAATQLNNYCF